MVTAKTLIRLGGCPGWSVFAGRTVTVLVLSCCGSCQKLIIPGACNKVPHEYEMNLSITQLHSTCSNRRTVVFVIFHWVAQPALSRLCICTLDIKRMLRSTYIEHILSKIRFGNKHTQKKTNLDTKKNGCSYPKIWIACFYDTVMCPKHAVWMANSVDPDQAAPADLVVHCLPGPVCHYDLW